MRIIYDIHKSFESSLSVRLNLREVTSKGYGLTDNKMYFYIKGPSWPWSYGSWIYNYLCNQCLSPLMLVVRISIRANVQNYLIKFVSDL